jgi:ferredoxin
MLHALAASGSARDVWWLHGARNRAEEPFATEARSLLAELAHGHGHVCYSRPGPGDVQGRDYQSAGRLSLLELAEACDVPVRWSCRTGVCHTCETALMSGTVSYSPDPVEEPADGSVLICCSQPSADLVLDL